MSASPETISDTRTRPDMDEPAIPQNLQWPLAALWISLGLHGALIALVQIAPPSRGDGYVIEARLVAKPAAPARLAPAAPRETSVPVTPTPAVPAPTPEKRSASIDSPAQPRSAAEAKPSAGVPLAVDLTYYTARELDVTPQGNIPEPVLPSTLPGRVRLRAKFEADGRVSAVEVLESEPPGVFDNAALEAFGRTRFTPGIKDGRPVRSVNVYELTINSDGAPEPPR